MNIEDFLQLKDDEKMSHAQSQLLNKELASASLERFTSKELFKIEEYLTMALNVESVEMSLINNLEAMVFALQRERLI